MKKLRNLHPKDPPNPQIKGRHKQRLRETIAFVGRHYNPDTILSIGQKNVFDEVVARKFIKVLYCNTHGDLDTPYWQPMSDKIGMKHFKFSTVFCFEVMEHLCNPLLFLRQLQKFIEKDAMIFISIPNHLLRRHWRTLHYHEIDPARFRHLCREAGYDIVEHKRVRYWPHLSDITGIRPLIRYLTGYSWLISKTTRHYYCIKLKP